MSYFRQAEDLTREQVLADLKAILGSEYFRQQEVYSSGCSIVTEFISIDRIGGFNDAEKRHFTLEEVAGSLEAILGNVEANPGISLKVRLTLYPSEEAKEEFGLTQKDVAQSEEWCEMGIQISVDHDKGRYQLTLYNPGLREKRSAKYRRQKAAYDKWYAELDAEFQKALPHMPEEPQD